MALLGGGSSAQLVRDVGTAGAVQGFRADGSLSGVRLSASLPFSALFQAGDGLAQNGVREVAGQLVSTLDAATLSASGVLTTAGGISGSLGVTLDAATVSSAGALRIAATLSQTLGDVTTASGSTLRITGT